MKITVLSSNQPRHLNLARELSSFAEIVYFVSEVNTIFPGKVSDFFKKSDVMQGYFSQVIESEKRIFGDIDFLPNNVRTLAVKSGDLNMLTMKQLGDALLSDLFVVFGSSYIKGWLIDFLISKNALNIHMGLSPYYRGSSCNFWALYDGNPAYVGATIHMLSKGLDNGDMLFHCIPKLKEGDTSFDFTMRSVLVAHEGLVKAIQSNSIFSMPTVKQDRSLEVRYTKNIEFTDSVVSEFLSRRLNLFETDFDYPELLTPFTGQ
ncbi:Formyl transferase domain protein [Leptospira interrogans serovar Manilae]|uniref:Formyl transferase domain protein n=1 Tax=Leptospira interrogans serovar Manilae TaxID=214675 RepID=A0AAQ1SQE8_LEPIR|nr:formyltransferase family protein [Leptospira interrogans]AKP26371.1 methionyl-tRNA formyltransferase [Leptospira interrogans serovar Manilae]AKP30155.1 methionyl-tRNA formyltransferase [Leptospira interrogans serovar Manilae]EYU63704.1 methionyl-tRNA formyltransferase [Leptospira interrogans serovar Manilae]SOR63296.1 Formyl transferase domain protein [Leptospira interrogans serovar Manilae]